MRYVCEWRADYYSLSVLSSIFQSLSSTYSKQRTALSTRVKERKATGSKFIPALSGLRGLASLGVVFFHEGGKLNVTFFGGIYIPLDYVGQTFFLGVPIFLMLSMYLLLNRLDANRDLKHYFKRRILRIWPIYYGTLIVTYIFFPYPLVDFIRYLFFVEYYVNPFGIFPVAVFWTLQLEEVAYVIIPLIHKLKQKNELGLGLVAGGFAYLSWMIFTSPAWLRPIYTLQVLLPIPFISYGFGILAYTGALSFARLRWLALAGIIGFAGVNAYYLGGFDFGSPVNYFVYDVVFYALALIGFAAIVARPPSILGWFTILGEESYALYAVHSVFVGLFGLLGIPLALLTAFLVEFSVRPREFLKRIRLGYSIQLGRKTTSTPQELSRRAEPRTPLLRFLKETRGSELGK